MKNLNSIVVILMLVIGAAAPIRAINYPAYQSTGRSVMVGYQATQSASKITMQTTSRILRNDSVYMSQPIAVSLDKPTLLAAPRMFAAMDDDEEDDDNFIPTPTTKETPIGDGIWLLLILVVGYIGFLYKRKRNLSSAVE